MRHRKGRVNREVTEVKNDKSSQVIKLVRWTKKRKPNKYK